MDRFDKSLLRMMKLCMDHLQTMRTYVAVATLGSFAEASRRLRLSPSAVTRSVADLEERLGLTLLNRTTRSVKLTDRGRIYLDSCRRILDDLDLAERQVRGEDADPRGELTIAAPVVFGRLHVLPVVTRLLAAFPDLNVRLVLSDRNTRLVEDGIDVAVRIGALTDSGLIATKLGEVGRVLVASPDYLRKRGAPDTPADLAAHDIVAFEAIEATNDWRFDAAAVRLEPRLVVNSADAAIAAAEQGAGVTRALSYQVEEAIRAGRLAPLLGTFSTARLPVQALYPARRAASPNVAAFVKAARERLRDSPPARGA